IKALIDSGCQTTCINKTFVEKHWLKVKPLKETVELLNADGSRNKNGETMKIALLDINLDGHKEMMEPLVTNLGDKELILGHDWLIMH
ncbi:hypothetical protein AMATHDRAFT_130166, partial [Amanita thiersii Skay4041]